jgi:hypothetical protein
MHEGGKRHGERFALTRLHFRHGPQKHGHATVKLHGVMTLSESAPSGLAHQRKSLGKERAETRTSLSSIAQCKTLLAEGLITKRPQARLPGLGLSNEPSDHRRTEPSRPVTDLAPRSEMKSNHGRS